MRRFGTLALAVVATGLVGCGAGRSTPPNTVPKPVASAADAVTKRIAQAEELLREGLADLRQGHVNGARERFDAAVELYLEAPGGAYSDPRLAEAYRKTLETVHVAEVEAMAQGQGLGETGLEPALIDEVGDLPMNTHASAESRRTAEAAVAEEVNDFPVELNDTVLASIDLYQGRLRDWFGEALARGGRYLPHIRETFAKEGIPQDLAYVALVESAFKTSAYSRAKARGVWQFIPATGKRYGLRQDWWIDERSDPKKATEAAAKYLKTLYELFGDWNLALAGYNAGEGRISRGLKKYGVDDFWSLAQTRALARETKNYVPLIHAAIVVAKAPEKYGFTVTPDAPLAYDRVAVEGAVDLRTVAECAGADLEAVRQLNPELRRMATPANRTFDVRIPPGGGQAAKACLDSLPADKRLRFRTHTVARGQTLSVIGRKYGLTASDLAAANGFPVTRRLSIGQELIVPYEPPRGATRAAAARPAPAPRAPSLQTREDAVRLSYKIKRGDTLSGIASQYGTTVGAIKSWNGLRSTKLAVGQVLTLYSQRRN
ncbi:MAG: LysM peptidoglycan-binding domain-containing protein [Vicinamibacteria bacterium]|nr:LysM peptidoglycan-binding domain-containing protein [Vicinamibacteria bacterium]